MLQMIRLVPVLLCFAFVVPQSGRAIVPAHKSRLNFTTVYFEEKMISGASVYELRICTDTSGKQPDVASVENKVPGFWKEKLDWGKTYFWKVTAFNDKREPLYTSAFHEFAIIDIKSSAFDKFRVAVNTNTPTKHSGGLICMDYLRSIVDRSGTTVWTIPLIHLFIKEETQIRDMRISKDNTITFLAGKMPLEMDFSGNILWRAPYPFIFNNDTVMYHHDLRKTSSNTYMVMGITRVYRKVTGISDTNTIKNEIDFQVMNGDVYRKAQMTVILEFDKEGKLLWFWDSNQYFKDEDLNYKKNPRGFVNFSTHGNAFSQNSEGTKVYVGFRDVSRIVKVDKLSKKVEMSYGEKYPSGEARVANGLFNHQHDATSTKRNTLLIFNNNLGNTVMGDKAGGVSSVIEFKDQANPKINPVIWKFSMDFDTLANGKSASGGNVVELPNSNLLVCTGSSGRVVEVTRKKEVVWDAFPEVKRKADTTWQLYPQYRTNWLKQINWYYFIAEIDRVKSEKPNTQGMVVHIHNTGNAPDAYGIEFYSGGKAIVQTVSPVVREGQSFTKTVLLNTMDDLEIKIVSKNSSKTLTIHEPGFQKK